MSIEVVIFPRHHGRKPDILARTSADGAIRIRIGDSLSSGSYEFTIYSNPEAANKIADAINGAVDWIGRPTLAATPIVEPAE